LPINTLLQGISWLVASQISHYLTLQEFCLHLIASSNIYFVIVSTAQPTASSNIYFVIVSTAQPTAFGYSQTVTKGLAKSDL